MTDPRTLSAIVTSSTITRIRFSVGSKYSEPPSGGAKLNAPAGLRLSGPRPVMSPMSEPEHRSDPDPLRLVGARVDRSADRVAQALLHAVLAHVSAAAEDL